MSTQNAQAAAELSVLHSERANMLAAASEPFLNTPTSTSCSWWHRCVNRISGTSCTDRVRSIINGIHSLPASAILTGASIVGLSVFTSGTAAAISSIALGYFGQTLASRLRERAEGENAKSCTLYATRAQQHLSLTMMMLTGYFTGQKWAVDLNSALFGMLVRLKLEQQEEASLIDADVVEDSSSPLGLMMVSSAFICAVAFGDMVYHHQLTGNRLLNVSVACAEYGLKALSGLAGFAFEKYVYKNRQDDVCKKIAQVVSKLEGVSIGLSLYGHQILPSNIAALAMCAPIGFFLGTSISRMLRLNRLENREHAAYPLPASFCSRGSILLQCITTAAFETFGFYLLFQGTDDTVGLEIFFILTPAFYYLTRYVFAKRQNSFLAQHVGHFVLHKSPQLISEELNYALSFLRAGTIEQTVANARIFFVFQALLFGSVEGSLFAIDEQEDAVPVEIADAEDPSSRQLILKKVRGEITRNYARVDMIMYIVVRALNK